MSAALGELGGILEQIAEDLRQPAAIGHDQQRFFGADDLQLELVPIERAAQVRNAVAQHGAQIERDSVQAQFAARDAGDVEQIVDQPRELTCLTVDDGARAIDHLALSAERREQEDAVGDGGQWIAEFMR